jgi:hypothetical protein
LSEVATLYRGLAPALVRGVAAGALSLGSNEYFKKVLGASETEPLSGGEPCTPSVANAPVISSVFAHRGNLQRDVNVCSLAPSCVTARLSLSVKALLCTYLTVPCSSLFRIQRFLGRQR